MSPFNTPRDIFLGCSIDGLGKHWTFGPKSKEKQIFGQKSNFWSIKKTFFDFWPKFWFLTKILIFDQNFDFWPIFRFLTKISIFDQNFGFWQKLRFFLTKTSFFFDKNFDFWPKFWFLTNISIVDQNLDFWPKFWPLTKTSFFLTKTSIFRITYFS